nr:hypothetical protein [Tanacetum cinerariifolium]
RVVILKRVEDLQLGVESYQKKLNITRPETFRFDISSMTPYTAYNNPQGIIYLDKFQRNRLMRSDELYKFCDGTLSSVQKVLHDIAYSLEMNYLPKRRWSKLDRKGTRIMIKEIDHQLFKRSSSVTPTLVLDEIIALSGETEIPKVTNIFFKQHIAEEKAFTKYIRDKIADVKASLIRVRTTIREMERKSDKDVWTDAIDFLRKLRLG